MSPEEKERRLTRLEKILGIKKTSLRTTSE